VVGGPRAGEVVRLPESGTGSQAGLWWVVRGCAPSFGVVTRAAFRTHPAGPGFVDRMVVTPDALTAYLGIATGLPRHTSMSAVLAAMPGDPGRPGLLVCTECASDEPAAAHHRHVQRGPPPGTPGNRPGGRGRLRRESSAAAAACAALRSDRGI